MSKHIIVLLSFFLSIQAIAQTYQWTKTTGGDYFDQLTSITSDEFGNTYSTGHFDGTVDFDPGPNVFNLSSNQTGYEINVYVQKLDPQGNFVWAITFPEVHFDHGSSITIDSSGNLIITGSAEVFGMGRNILIFKLDPQGNVLFFNIYGNNVEDAGTSVITDAQNNIYSIGQFQNTIDIDPGAGVFNLTANGNADIFIQKLDSNGNFIWAKSIGGNALDIPRHLNIDTVGNLYISGFFSETCDFDPGSGVSNMTSNGSWDAFIVKLNNNGELIWHKGFGSIGIDDASSCDIDSEGNVIITGFFNDTVDFNPNAGVYNITSNGEEDPYILKLDSNGEFLWAKTFGSIYHDGGSSVVVDDLDAIYATGHLYNPENFDPDGFNPDYDVFINKYTSDGNLIWDIQVGGIDVEIGHAIHVDNFYNIYVGGYFHGTTDFNPDEDEFDNFVSNGAQDIFITKYSQDINIPIAYPLSILVSCDDDMDGFSENFDTSEVESTVLNGQTDLVVTYYDENGNELPSPLPNPFTNTSAFSQNITVRLTDSTTLIYVETVLELQVATGPNINQPSDIYACDDGNGFASFDTSTILQEIIGTQTGLVVLYFDENGDELESPLSNSLQNTIANQETITVRVYHEGNDTCYTEVSFDLIVELSPVAFDINDIYECDTDNDGFEVFDLSIIESFIQNNPSNLTLEYYSSDTTLIPTNSLSNYTNIIPHQDYITVRVFSDVNDCYFDTIINLIADNMVPVSHPLDIIYGCDDNNDGISEYFDTSDIESQVLNGQTNMNVTYFTETGDELPSPLPNPYTNTLANNQTIIVRVTNSNSNCYSETLLELQTVTQPSINQPDTLFACDQGNGYAEFDTSTVEQQIVGNQSGLTITYFDSNNNQLPSPLPLLFQNTEPFNQTITVRVEYTSNPICYSETSFDLVVNSLPEISLEDNYFICYLEPYISLHVDSGFNSYEWTYEDGTIISSTYQANIINEGNYNLTVTYVENGLSCENSFAFSLTHSNIPEIQQVNYGELGNNFIEIIVAENGNFEYSIDGFIYQNSNYFNNVQGGVYTVYVRDKEGCGEDSTEVVIIDYPKFFTPNSDGYNDYWQIKGIHKFPNSKIFIFDRYGKLLKQLSANSHGWDGSFNGKILPTNDYWFTANLGNGKVFSGHFSLKR